MLQTVYSKHEVFNIIFKSDIYAIEFSKTDYIAKSSQFMGYMRRKNVVIFIKLAKLLYGV